MKKIMGILQANYRCRLYVNYLLGMGSFLRGIWTMIKGMLDETTVRKIRILDDKDTADIFSFINEEQVEKRFGGKARDVVPQLHNCFPPIMPSTNFLKSNDRKEDLLISESEYKIKYQKGLVSVTSEYYLNKWKLEDDLKMEEEKRQKEILEKQEQEQKRRFTEEHNVIVLNPLTLSINAHSEFNIESMRMVEELTLDNELSATNKNKMSQLKTKYTKESVESITKQYFRDKSFLSDMSPDVFVYDRSKKIIII
jgi:hypothetical protein